MLAEEIVPNGSTSNWVIRLKPGVTFHNGKPFGADDVIYTLQTILNPKKPLGGALVLTPVDVKGLKKVDNLTVEVPMTSPVRELPRAAGGLWYFLYIAPDGWTQKDKPNGTGPFMYKSFTPGQQSVFVRNKNYWKPGPPLPGLGDDPGLPGPHRRPERPREQGHRLHRAADRDPDEDPAEHAGIMAVPSQTGAIEPFTMRVDKPPFNDVNVRQAFRYLINRPEFIAKTLDGFGWVAQTSRRPTTRTTTARCSRDQDIALARSLLKKAGYDNNLTVTLYTSLAVNSSALSMATLFKQQASAAGVTVNLNQVSPRSFFGPNYYTKVPFSQIYYNYSPYLSQVAQTFLPTSPFQETHFNNPKYTKLYSEANKTQSPSVRKRDHLRDAADRLHRGRLHHSRASWTRSTRTPPT